MFAAICEQPEFYKKHLFKFVALAPVLRVSNIRSPTMNNLINDDNAIRTIKMMGPEIMTIANKGDPLSTFFSETLLGDAVSYHTIKDISDSDPSLISKEGFSNYTKFYPAGTSFQSFNHFRQMAMTGEFRKYNYESSRKNIAKYGQAEPPFFDTQNIRGFKITLVCGKGDLLASPQDYTYLKDILAPMNDLNFFEYDEGHLAILMPKDQALVDRVFCDIVVDASEANMLEYSNRE